MAGSKAAAPRRRRSSGRASPEDPAGGPQDRCVDRAQDVDPVLPVRPLGVCDRRDRVVEHRLGFNVIHSVEKFVRSLFDLQTFKFRPGVVLQSSALGGGVMVLLATGANVLAALLYNLISDIVGGVQLIVLEEATTLPSELLGGARMDPGTRRVCCGSPDYESAAGL